MFQNDSNCNILLMKKVLCLKRTREERYLIISYNFLNDS